MSKIHTLDFADLAKFWGLDVSDIASIYGLDFACPEIGVSENFEGTGFQLTGWTVNEDGPPFGEIDEDYDASTVTGAPAGWNAQCVEILANADWSVANIERAFPQSPIEYHRFDIIWSQLPFFGTANQPIFVMERQGTTRFEITMETDGTGTHLWLSHEGGLEYQFGYLSTDTLYTIETRYDRVALEWEWRINGVLQPNNVDDSSPVTSPGIIDVSKQDLYFDKIRIGTDAFGWTSFIAYVDNYQWSSCGWIV